MIVDRLIVHHNYDGRTAVDVSENRNHGRLEGVQLGGGSAHFGGGGDCVRILSTADLQSLRAVRTAVRFKWEPGPKRRYNLIEGFLSFALVIDDDGSLHGTINNKQLGWIGAQSAAHVVQPGVWHEALMVHDGFSAIRVDLDGHTVAESFDVRGPMRGVAAPLGICIGHWAGDDRYSFIGEIDDVKVWRDRPESIKDLADRCCADGAAIDDLFARVRAGEDWGPFDPDAYRNAAEVMLDVGARTFGRLAAGGEAERVAAWDLARRALLAHTTADRAGLEATVAQALDRLLTQASTQELQPDFDELVAALRPTPLWPLLAEALAGGSMDQVRGVARKQGVLAWLDAFCFGWGVPPGESGGRDGPVRDDGRPRGNPSGSRGPAGGDPATDHEPGVPPPSWGYPGSRYSEGSRDGKPLDTHDRRSGRDRRQLVDRRETPPEGEDQG